MWVHYVKPQENGSHYSTRMVDISNDKNALKVLSDTPFSFSTSIYNQFNLWLLNNKNKFIVNFTENVYGL